MNTDQTQIWEKHGKQMNTYQTHRQEGFGRNMICRQIPIMRENTDQIQTSTIQPKIKVTDMGKTPQAVSLEYKRFDQITKRGSVPFV